MTLVVPQRSAMVWRALFSASSTVRFQRSLVAVHSAPYRHRASGAGGSQVEGSWSALMRLERAVTAIRLRGAAVQGGSGRRHECGLSRVAPRWPVSGRARLGTAGSRANSAASVTSERRSPAVPTR